MNPDIFPTVYLLVLVELLFGLAYDQVVKFVHAHGIWHVSVSVVIGVFMTGLIFIIFMFDKVLPAWQFGLIVAACFAGSGLPMAIGSVTRDVKDRKKKRPLGNSAARLRDEVVMELTTMANDIAERIKNDQLTIRDLPDLVNRLRQMKSMLKLM